MDIMEYGEDMVKEENMSKIADFFKFRERNTSYKKELIAGITTFMTMAYVLVVQPPGQSSAMGMPHLSSMPTAS